MSLVSKKLLFRIHGWVGLHFGLVLFVICLSGTVATLSEEIDWCINPAVRVSPGGKPLAWDVLESRIESEISDSSVVAIHAPRGRRTACQVEVETGFGQRETLLVNQYTGAIQGAYSFHSVKYLFRIFHKQFYIFGIPEGIHGIYLVGSYGLALLTAALTGLLFYKRFWLRMLIVPWRRRSTWRDWHRFLGVWTWLLILVWSVTGVWYLAEHALYKTGLYIPAGVSLLAQQDLPRTSLPPSQLSGTQLSTSDYLRIAAESYPELRVTSLYLPQVAGGPAMIFGKPDLPLLRDWSGQLLIDSFTGDVLDERRPKRFSAIDLWHVSTDALHFGTLGGLATKVVWFIFGIGVSLAIPTGAVIWVRRTSNQIAGPHANKSSGYRTGKAKALSIAANSTILTLAAGYTFAMSPPRVAESVQPPPVAILGAVEIGPWTAEVTRRGVVAPGQPLVFRLRFPGAELPSMKQAALRLGDTESVLAGTWHYLAGELPAPGQVDSESPLVIAVEANDGSTFRSLIASETWKKEATATHADPLPTASAPLAASIIFGAFLAVVATVTVWWFWKIG